MSSRMRGLCFPKDSQGVVLLYSAYSDFSGNKRGSTVDHMVQKDVTAADLSNKENE